MATDDIPPLDVSHVSETPQVVSSHEFEAARQTHVSRNITLAKPLHRNADAAKREQRRVDAYQHWLKNVPVREIAKKLGCSPATAWRAVDAYREAMRKANMQSTERKRDKHTEQLERVARKSADNEERLEMIASSSDASTQAKVLAAEAINRAHEVQTRTIVEVSKLTGTQMPTKIASTTPDGLSWAPLQFTLSQIPTEKLLVLRELHEMRVLNGAAPIDAQVVDADKVDNS